MGRTIRVKPLPKSAQTPRVKWQVLVSGERKSRHETKANAKSAAKREMRAADTVIIHKSSGAKQRQFSGPRA